MAEPELKLRGGSLPHFLLLPSLFSLSLLLPLFSFFLLFTMPKVSLEGLVGASMDNTGVGGAEAPPAPTLDPALVTSDVVPDHGPY